jgi:hypothetical protein
VADDKHYVGGDYYMVDDLTGYKVRASRMKRMWTGEMWRDQSWEPRQPQDFVRGVPDDQTVPIPRPRSVNIFIGPTVTTISANAAAGANSLTVDNTIGFNGGDSVGLILDNGVVFMTTIESDPSGDTINLSGVLPYSAANGNTLTNYTSSTTV